MKPIAKRLLFTLLSVLMLFAFTLTALAVDNSENRQPAADETSNALKQTVENLDGKITPQESPSVAAGNEKGILSTQLKSDSNDFSVNGNILTGYSGSDQFVDIPASLGVTIIGANAFKGKNNITSITVPEGILEIQESAFNGMKGLQSISLPSSLTKISNYAFEGCTGLQSFTVPANVTTIGNKVFNNCSALQQIHVDGNSLTTIGEEAFCNTPLNSINLPDSVVTIGKQAFNGLTSLTGIHLGNAVTNIGESAFSGTGLRDVTIPGSVNELSPSVFSGCTSLLKVSFNDGIAKIGKSAFSGCSALNSVSLPESLTIISEAAFENTAISNINWPSSLQRIETGAFKNNTGITNLDASNLFFVGYQAFYGATGLSSANLSSVETIGEEAFANTSSLATVTLSASLKNLGKSAFYSSGLTHLTIPGSVSSVPEFLCAACSKLKSVVIGKGISTIQGGSFKDCTSLSSVSIPDSVTTIKQAKTTANCNDTFHGAFEGCKMLKNVTIPSSVTTVEGRSFFGCENLTRILVPKSVTVLGDDIFTGCSVVKVFVHGGSNALEYCKSKEIRYLVIPDEIQDVETAIALESGQTGDDDPTSPSGERVDIASASISKIKNQVYTGKNIEPEITVKYNETALKAGTDYTVHFAKNKNVGKATVTVKGKGNYTGEKKATFIIEPASVKLSKVKAAKKQLNISWKKGKGIDGYEIQYSLKKNFKGSDTKTVTIKSASKTGITVKKLKSKKTYYVRIRTYKKSGGKTYYSSWSKVQKGKVK